MKKTRIITEAERYLSESNIPSISIEEIDENKEEVFFEIDWDTGPVWYVAKCSSTTETWSVPSRDPRRSYDPQWDEEETIDTLEIEDIFEVDDDGVMKQEPVELDREIFDDIQEKIHDYFAKN